MSDNTRQTAQFMSDILSPEFNDLRRRIKAAADVLQPGLGDELGRSTSAHFRSRVNEVTGANVPNGLLLDCMRALADAIESKARGAI